MLQPDALERLVALGSPEYTGDQVAEQAGVDRQLADRLWRALGFPDTQPDAEVYSEQDVRALRLVCEGLDEVADARREHAVDLILEEARTLSAFLADLAEAELGFLAELSTLGLRRRTLAEAVQQGLERSDLGWLLQYALRRQLAAAARRVSRVTSESSSVTATVGFADLVGFTARSRQLAQGELSALLGSFQRIAFDLVAESGGRVVKLVGDEVMFVCPESEPAAHVALGLIDQLERSGLPPVRAALARGPLLARGGDYFGTAVNLASRLVSVAAPATVLVDAHVAEELGVLPDLQIVAIEPVDLKGFGVTRPFALRAVSSPASSPARSSSAKPY